MSARSAPSLSVSFLTLFKIVAVALGVVVIWLIRDIVLYCFLAMLLAGIIYPLANWGARHRIPKVLTVLFVYLLIFGGVALVVTLMIPALLTQSEALVMNYGSWLGNANQFLKDISFLHQIEGAGFNLSTGLSSLGAQLQSIFGNALSTLAGIFGGLAGALIVLVLALYMVIEDLAIKKIFHAWVPKAYHGFSTKLVSMMMDKLGAWMRGQLLMCFVVGMSYFVAFEILRVPYALLLAVLGGIFQFVPYIGPIVSTIPVVVITFPQSPLMALIAVVVITIIQQLENNILAPKIMQKAVGLNPIVSIVSFLIGAKLFGAVGAIIGIPVAVAVAVAMGEWRTFREKTPHLRS